MVEAYGRTAGRVARESTHQLTTHHASKALTQTPTLADLLPAGGTLITATEEVPHILRRTTANAIPSEVIQQAFMAGARAVGCNVAEWRAAALPGGAWINRDVQKLLVDELLNNAQADYEFADVRINEFMKAFRAPLQAYRAQRGNLGVSTT